jgi:hypothetical protein
MLSVSLLFFHFSSPMNQTAMMMMICPHSTGIGTVLSVGSRRCVGWVVGPNLVAQHSTAQHSTAQICHQVTAEN